jgi:site-specific DNA recombinase
MAYTKLKQTNPRVAIYVRVSTLHQIDKDSLPMQKQDLLAYAKLMLGTKDCVIFEDAGYSGKNTDRPKFQEMMSQIRAGGFSHLLVWKIDRISRNLLDFATMYNELKNLGVIFVSKNEQFDTSTAMGEAMLKIILVFAELERNMTSERVTATMISRANNGLWNGGRIPYGYDYDYDTHEFTPSETEAPVVRLIHDLYEKERSLVRESRILNSKGYRTRTGNEWNPVSLHIILHNIFYCGDYRYNVLKEGDRQKVKDESEWITIKEHHPPIITREQKERITSILDMRSKQYRSGRRRNSGRHTHIFGGLVICGNCGSFMVNSIGNKKDWSYTRYLCPSKRKSSTICTGKSTSDPIIGEFVLNYILNMLNAQKNFENISSPDDLQAALLIGNTFSYIDGIEPDGVLDLYNILASGKVQGAVFGKGTNIKPKDAEDSEITSLRAEKQKMERALDRLRNLYLYSENAMSEKEYIIQRTILTEKLDEINDEIGMMQSDEWQQSVTDEMFIAKASEFIISQKLTDRNYINYKRLAQSVDAEVLRNFLTSIIDSIIITDGMVQRITFKNGLSHFFIFKQQ